MKKIIYVSIIVIIGLVAVSLAWFQFGIKKTSDNTEPVPFTIVSGETTSDIADRLETQGLIDSSFVFKVYLALNKELVIQAGEYTIDPKTPLAETARQLASGRTVSREVTILIKEGWTVKEINAQIKKQGYLLDDSFLRAAAAHEGYLFPDTYRVFKDFTAEDLIKKMKDNLDRKLTPELRADIADSGHSVGEIMIMASILQKEVRTEQEMKLASGVFWNRLSVGQALQSCATLAYILGVNKPQYSYEDTQVDSPYNTYQHRGLPPGPVSNPGLVAINAAIHPTPSDYNYFLARPDTGETIFSKTLDEHNAAKAKYLK